MQTYPISASRDFDRGSNPSRLRKAREYNRIAARVEDFINDDLKDKPDDKICQYLSRIIALELGEDNAVVHSVVFSIDCGHNGVTIVKGSYDKAMANLGK